MTLYSENFDCDFRHSSIQKAQEARVGETGSEFTLEELVSYRDEHTSTSLLHLMVRSTLVVEDSLLAYYGSMSHLLTRIF